MKNIKCPFCGEEMEHGYFHVGMSLWSSKKHKLTLNPAADERYAMKLSRPLRSPHRIESDYCVHCQKIIIDSSSYEHRD